jgi:hypothetical protein
MSSEQRDVPTPADRVVEKMAAKPREVSWILFGLAALLAAIPIATAATYKAESRWLLIWGIVTTLYVLGVAIWVHWSNQGQPGVFNTTDRMRLVLLLVLGGLGFLLAVYGLVLPFCTPPYAAVDYPAIFVGGMKSWRQHRWDVARCMAALLGGLLLMFVGVLSARAFERTSSTLRRVVYGYNAVLTSLLLILSLALLNILPYSGVWPFSYANEPIDWTRTGLHTLHDATRNLVADLKQPVKVYALGPSSFPPMKDMMDLLDRCRYVNPQQFSWEHLSRDRNTTDLRELMGKYNMPDSQGVLIVYGTEKDELTDFIRLDDLYSASRGARYTFKGENALLNSLTYLSSAKHRAVVYFTQGNGELDYKDRSANEIDGGMGQLIDELGRINYETRELAVTETTDTIPDDADIVVIARPDRPVAEKFLQALRDFMQGTKRKEGKKGKLIVLFDVVVERGKDTMVRTGLEKLVEEHGVRVNDVQLVAYRPMFRDYLLIAGMCPDRSKNPIARAFSSETEGTLSLFTFYKARTVESSRPNAPGAPPGNEPEPIVGAVPNQGCVVQKELGGKPRELVMQLQRNPEQLRALLNRAPLAVAVSEGKTPAPIPGHEFMAKEGQPRMVVFGDASWISNGLLLKPSPNNFHLFASCLGWLAERPDLGNRVPTTEHDMYQLKHSPDSDNRLLLLPGFLMVLGVMALGLGVWVVRRR